MAEEETTREVEEIEQAPSEAAAEAAPAREEAREEAPWSFDHEWGGTKFALNRDQVSSILNQYLDALQGNAQEAPAAQATQERTPSEIDSLRGELEEVRAWKREQEIKSKQRDLLADLDRAVSKVDFFKKEFGDDVDGLRDMKSLVLAVRSANPAMSWDAAAQSVAKRYGGHFAKRDQKFVEDRVKANERSAPGAGGSSTSGGPKKLGSADLWNDNVLRAAMERVEASLKS